MRPSNEPFSALLERHPELTANRPELDSALEVLATTFRNGRQVLVCGNGGSAADAEHIVGELMKSMSCERSLGRAPRAALSRCTPQEMAADGSYLADRLENALPAISLGSHCALVSAIANDTGADMVFSQQVFGYGREGDLLWALSTSGRSRNVVLAAITAKSRGVSVLAMTGESGEPLGRLADVWVRVPVADTPTVQELHVAVYHSLCAELERRIFGA
jgi:phosphoheptose isomerase